jgi:hypothetical protein
MLSEEFNFWCLQLYLLTYEFPDTIAIVTSNSVTFLTSSKKGASVCCELCLQLDHGLYWLSVAYLEPVIAECNKGSIRAAVLARSGDDDAALSKLLSIVNESEGGGDVKLGRLTAGDASSTLIANWSAKLRGIPTVDPSKGVDNAFAIKSKLELVCCSPAALLSGRHSLCVRCSQGNIQTAAKLTSRLYRKVLVAGLEAIMEADKKVKQSVLTEKMEKALDSLEKYGIKVDASLCSYGVEPVVQSGGKYNLDITKTKACVACGCSGCRHVDDSGWFPQRFAARMTSCRLTLLLPVRALASSRTVLSLGART